MTNAIVPYKPPRKVFTIGDGATRFTLPGERPQTGEEKYQKPLHEAMADFREAMDNFTVCFIEQAIKPLHDIFQQFAVDMEHMGFKVEQSSKDLHETVSHIDLKAEARRRSREDLERKRREQRSRKGRF